MNRVRLLIENRTVGKLDAKPQQIGSGIIKRAGMFLALMFAIAIFGGTAQAASYTWNGGASGSWATSTNWSPTRTTPAVSDVLTFNSGGSVSATTIPTQTIGQLIISSSTAVTLTSQSGAARTLTIGNAIAGTDLDVQAGSSLTLADGGSGFTVNTTGTTTGTIAGTLTVNAGCTWDAQTGTASNSVTGTVVNSGTITGTTGELSFASGAKYQHNFANGGTIPTATWNANSTVEVIGALTGTTAPGGLGQSFGHFTWNPASQTSAVNLSSGLTTVNGNFTVSTTGASELRLAAGSNVALAIGGDYIQTGGTFVLTNGNGVPTVNLSGNFTMSGGTLNMSSDNNTDGILNVGGNFSHTAGATITESNTSVGEIVFTAGTHTYTSGGTVSNTINFTVNSGSTLQMGTNLLGNGSNGTFDLLSGATLGIGDASGITTSGASGNIRVSGTRTYATGANYIYNGSANQAVGNGLPATVSSLTVANTGAGGSNTVTHGAALTLTGNLTVTSGVLDPNGVLVTGSGGANTLSVSGTLIVDASTFAGNYTSFETRTLNAGSTVEYKNATPTIDGSLTYQNLTFSGTGTTGNPSADLVIQGTLANTGGGTLNFSARNVTLSGTVAANNVAGFTTTGSVSMTKTSGTATLTGNVNGGALAINGTSGTVNLGTALSQQFTSLTFTAGTLDCGSSTLSLTGNLTGNTGTFTTSTSTVVFNGSGAQTFTRTVATTFNNLTISNAAGVTNSGAVRTVNGTLTLTAGVLTLTTGLTMGTGANISRDTGSLSAAPTFGTSVNVTYTGTTAVTTGNEIPTSTTVLNNLTINKSGGVTLSAAVTANGTVTLTSGAFDVSASNFAITVGGNWANNGGTFTPRSGTVTFNSTAGAQAINGSAATQTFNNLTVVKNTQTLSVGGSTTTLTLAGDLTITTGTFAAGTATAINVAGNWTNNSGSGFTSDSSSVVFNGSTAQTIGGSQPTIFNGLKTSNSAGVALGVNATVTGVLDLANGDIRTGISPTFAFILRQSGTSSASGGFDVVGNVNRTDLDGGAPRSFGNVNVIITETAGTVTSFTVNLVKGASSLTGSVKREYGLTPNGGTNLAATVRLRYLESELNGNGENDGPVCTLTLWKKTGTTWSTQGSSACSSTENWAETATSSFSQWTLKAGTGAPTACKLEGFQAARSDDGVVLEWRTGYEVNNVGFNVYRQGSDGEMVKLTKHMVAGSGLMVRKNTALTSGLSYYWSDPDTKKGDHPQYWLEDLDADGHTSWNGPFIINEALVPTRPTPGGKAAPGEKGGRGDANSMTINSISEENEQSGVYQPSGPVESTAKAGKMKLAAAVQQADLAGKPAVKISINREGWYRITQAQLVAAGISTSTDGKKLQLFADSQEIPIIVGGNGRGFDPSAYIEFYGQGLDTPSTDTRVYWLVVGANGLRIKTFTGLSGGSAGDSFPYTVQRKDRLFYRSEIQNGDAENFFGAFIYYQPTDQALTVNRIAPAANTTLEIALQGFNAGPHQVQVSLNGAIVGTLNFNDRVRQVFTLTAPQALLTEGANKVTLQALAGNSDFSFVDYIKLTYAHKFEAENNSLKLTAPGSSSVTLNGFTGGNIRVVDVTDPKAVQELLPKPSQGNSTPATSITVVTFGGVTRTLLAFVDTKQAAKVAANKPSSLRQSSNQADLVIIGAGDFSSSLQSLQSLRQGQGIQTMLLDVEDVYDEFSFGQKSPNAVKDFLSYARTNWKKAPKYVLLGGMASFDPRNYMGLGNTDFVPTKIVMTEHLETASDDWFVDFNNDGMPEMALGRLPARNADEAARMVQKLVNYDQAASGAGVLLVADVNKGFDFEHNNDLLKAIVPNTTAVQDLRRASDPQAKQTLLTALNQGKKLVNYTGHGSVDIWEASLLTSTDAAGLANAQKLSLVVAMTCLNGYFFDERFESLAHALVNAQNGGAVAVWSSTGLTEPDPQSLADQELFRQLFAGASVRLGDAALKAKAVITDSDVRRTWVLIGDPTMRFKQ